MRLKNCGIKPVHWKSMRNKPEIPKPRIKRGKSESDFPRFILGFGISGLLRIDFQCTGFIPQFFNLIDAVAFGNGFAHRFVPDECGWLRFCWHGVLVPAHASLRCGSSSNRFRTFARDIRELPHLRALPDTRALSYTRALPNTHAFPDTRASPNTRALSYTHASPSWLKFSSFSM